MTTEELIKLIDARLRSDGPDALLSECRMRLLEPHDATRWRPIREAPKDGTYVLLFDRESMVIPIIGSWELRSVDRGKAWHDVSLNDIEEEHGFIPTHFMPLPEGPK